MIKENLRNKINKNIPKFLNNTKDKKILLRLNKLLSEWATLNNKSFRESCMDFNLYPNLNLGNITKLPF